MRGRWATATAHERFAAEIRCLIAAGREVAALTGEHDAMPARRAVPAWRSVLDALLTTGSSQDPCTPTPADTATCPTTRCMAG